MDEWLRWGAGIVAGAALALSGWLLKLAHDLDKRVTVLEQRPHIDPVEYTRAVTELTVAMANLTTQLAENNLARREQYIELRDGHEKLWNKLDEIERDLRRVLQPGRTM